eukprot:3693717-Amphidinium_carterae.2
MAGRSLNSAGTFLGRSSCNEVQPTIAAARGGPPVYTESCKQPPYASGGVDGGSCEEGQQISCNSNQNQ